MALRRLKLVTIEECYVMCSKIMINKRKKNEKNINKFTLFGNVLTSMEITAQTFTILK